MKNPFCVKTDGNFSFWLKPYVYKVIRTQSGSIKNTKTGENCGKIVYLYAYQYDSHGKKLCTPVYDSPDCYEIISEDA